MGSSVLPVHGHPNLCAAVLFDALHVLAPDHSETAAAHFAVDARAKVLRRLPDLSLAITSVQACEDNLLISGEDESSRMMLLSLNREGNELWRSPLALGRCVTRAPKILSDRERALAVWEETEDDQSFLLVSQIRSMRCEPPQRFFLPGVTQDLDVVLTPTGLVAARVAGFPPRCSLLHVDQSGNLHKVDLDRVGAGPIALATVDHGLALAWIEEQRVSVRKFDFLFEALGDSVWLNKLDGEIERLRVYGAHRAALVVTSRKGKPGARQSGAVAKIRSRLLLDHSVLEVPSPVGWIETGGWLKDSFVLIHGDGPVTASAFAAGAARHEPFPASQFS